MYGELSFIHVHYTCESDLFILREDRGFSSLPINLILDVFHEELYRYCYGEDEANPFVEESYYEKDPDLEYAEEFADGLYLAVIAISGFLNEFLYASGTVKEFIWSIYEGRSFRNSYLLPLWGKERWMPYALHHYNVLNI